MLDKAIQLKLSDAAKMQLQGLASPLLVELEMYFSCLIRFRVVFPDRAQSDYISLKSDNNKLQIYFHPIMTKHCNIEQIRGHDPDTETFPIKQPEKFIPKWLKLDYRKQQWVGEFGF